MSRSITDLTRVEWNALVSAFADKVLTKFNVAGSIATTYSLYSALDREYARAIRNVKKEKALWKRLEREYAREDASSKQSAS